MTYNIPRKLSSPWGHKAIEYYKLDNLQNWLDFEMIWFRLDFEMI